MKDSLADCQQKGAAKGLLRLAEVDEEGSRAKSIVKNYNVQAEGERNYKHGVKIRR